MDSLTIDGTEYRVFDHLYAVSACGTVLRGNIGKGFQSCTIRNRKDGYCSASSRLVHRMVATCWLSKPDGAKVVHHINEDKTDNRAENLEWVTQSVHMGARHNGISGRYPRTQATKEKISQSRRGKRPSAQSNQKRSETIKRLWAEEPERWASRKAHLHTEETKAKMSRNNGKSRQCEVHGVRYRSFTEAATALGQRPLSLRRRCLSSNFPGYRVV